MLISYFDILTSISVIVIQYMADNMNIAELTMNTFLEKNYPS